MIKEISLNNPQDMKLLKKLGKITEFKRYLETKLLNEAYTIINTPHHETPNERL
jgi:hypothetical protein